MSQTLPSFDPSAQLSGQIQTNMGTNPGRLVVANHSGITIILTLPDGSQKKCWANTARLIPIDIPAPFINWKQDAVLSIQGQANRVDLEMYGATEDMSEVYPIALAIPSQLTPAAFVTIGDVAPSAANIWTNIGNTIFIGNFPFSNNEIANGLGASGVVYFQVYSCTVTLDPVHRDGTTVEGAVVNVRLIIVDVGGVNVSTFTGVSPGGGAFFAAEIMHRGGGDQNTATLSAPSPIYVPCNVAVGGGPPYSMEAQIETNDPYPGLFAHAVVSIAYGLTAIAPPGLT